MAIVIDISQWTRPTMPTTAQTAVAAVTVERQRWDACKHLSMEIDPEQRTVKCGECGMWLDPVWCLQELFTFYDKRVDQRLATIAEFERREQEARDRKAQRKKQPREHLRRRRAESLERAAYNEYQAKLLLIRADKQRVVAEKLSQELGEPASINAVDPQGERVTG